MSLKILFLAANPSDTDQLRLDEEARAIDDALRKAEYRDHFDLQTAWAVRVDDLSGLLMRHKPHIVHFSGHGSAANEIILQDHDGQSVKVPPLALGMLFRILKDDIRCVVLNACYSAGQGEALAEHIDTVVGMSDAISDVAAIQFAASFYQGLAYGRSVEEAHALGAVQIAMHGLGEEHKPQLLGAGDASQVKLVDPAEVEAAEAARPRDETTIINSGSGSVASGQGAVAAGERGIAIGGDASDSTLITGDNAQQQSVDTGGGAYIGGNVDVGQGDFVGRDKNVGGDEVHGDKFTGDKVAGDKITGDKIRGDKVMGDKTEGDDITVGNISGSTGVAIGKGSSATVTQTTNHGVSGDQLAQLFAPLMSAVAGQTPAVEKAQALQVEVEKGKGADDDTMGNLVADLVDLVPSAASAIGTIFVSPLLGGLVGPGTKFILKRLGIVKE